MTTRRVAYSVVKLHQLWASGESYAEIAAALGCSESYVHVLKQRHKLPDRPREYAAPAGDPTPDEIRARAEEIKARHLAELRNETDDQTYSRVYKEDIRRGTRQVL